MTGQHVSADDDIEQRVAAHLRAHSDFLNRHPDLLADLQLPHATGSVVPLVERQVAALREHNRGLKQRLKDLIAIARDNETLSRRVHGLSLALLRAGSAADVVTTVREGLRREFRADRVLVRLFGEAAGLAVESELQGSSTEREEFAEILAQGKACCGRLNRRRQELVFAGPTAELGSAVLLPLQLTVGAGLLVIASLDPQRYRPDLGLELLTYLADVLGVALDARLHPIA